MKLNLKKICKARLARPEYKGKINLQKCLKLFDYSKHKITREDLLKNLNIFEENYPNPQDVISQAEMREDLAQLKFLIKNIYAGYKLFGNKFFENSFKIVEKFVSENQSATVENFTRVIYQSLAGAQDMHLSLRCTRDKFLIPAQLDGVERTYLNSDFDIEKCGKDFLINGEKILSINGDKNVKNYVALVCNSAGTLKLGFVERTNFKFATKKKIKLNCLLESGKTVVVELSEKQNEKFTEKQRDANQAQLLGDCLFIRHANCRNYTEQQRGELARFYQQIENGVKNAKYVVIDARGNSGGSDEVNKQVMKLVLGLEDFQSKITIIDLCSKCERLHSVDAIKSNVEYVDWVWESYQQSLKDGHPNISRVVDREESYKKNGSKPVFVLTDRNSLSAGEEYNAIFSGFEEVMFLNDNTRGCVHLGNVRSYVLNNSKIRANLQVSFFMFGGANVEKKGFKPDVYFNCNADEIISTLGNFINKNTEFEFNQNYESEVEKV